MTTSHAAVSPGTEKEQGKRGIGVVFCSAESRMYGDVVAAAAATNAVGGAPDGIEVCGITVCGVVGDIIGDDVCSSMCVCDDIVEGAPSDVADK
jgi:hypothetical protein